MIASVTDRLEAHGVTYTRTDARACRSPASSSASRPTRWPRRDYQGTHKARTLTGAWEAQRADAARRFAR